METLVKSTRLGKINIITLDRPKANAINIAMSEQLTAAFKAFREDDSLVVAIVTGAGDKFFCGGWDMNEAPSDLVILEDRKSVV